SPKREASVACEPRFAEGIGYCVVPGADEYRGLKRERHLFDQSAGGSFQAVASFEQAPQCVDAAIVRSVPSAGGVQLVEEGIDGAGGTAHGAEHVEALHVARAFPDGVQRCLAVEARQNRLLDIAVSAEALLRLVDRCGGALADP